jgi:hypothetical protein
MDPNRRKRAGHARWPILLIATLALALGGSANADVVARHRAPCPRRGAHVLARDTQIVMYLAPQPDGMIVCDRATGYREATGADDVFPAPAVAVAGELYVYGNVAPGTGESIEAGRLLPRNSGSPPSGAALIAGEFSGRDAKLITVKLKSDGAYAWMTCEIIGSVKAYLATGPHARCEHTGVPIWVYKHDATQADGQALTLLAHGNTIDPQSLQLRGSVVSWRQRGRTRTARLD